MSPRSSSTKKTPPAPDIYVALLIIGFATMVFGITLLGLELNAYNWSLPG